MGDLRGKVAIVTGASRGIGKGVALGLAEQGATVYVTGRTEKDDLLPGFFKGTTIHQTANEINALGGVGHAVRCDHSNDEEVKELFERVYKECGRLDILVNNAWAGANHAMQEYFWNKPFWAQPVGMFDDFYRVGLRSSFTAGSHAAKIMSDRRSGLIVNISFFSSRRYWLNAAHGVFKAATDKLTADMAHDLGDYGVSVFSLYPGTVSTEGMLEAAKYDPNIDISKMETPRFIGRCIAAMAQDASIHNKTGSVLIAAEVAKEYSINDINGNQPRSLRAELWADQA